MPTAEINKRGALTVWQRLEYLVDPGTWQPLHSLYNPEDNEEGTTNVVDGLGKIAGRWAVIIGFDNKVLAGAWIAGQPDNILRVTNLAKRLHIPLVWLVNCSGVKLPDQEKFYADRRGGGTASSAMPNWSRPAFRSSPASTAPIRPAAAIRRSARPSCSRTRTPTSRSAASASSPACRRRAASTSRGWRS